MKLPSLRQIVQDARSTLVRFPLVLCLAVLGTVAALVLADHEGPAQPTLLFNILLTCILGIPLLLGLAVVAEKRRMGKQAAWGLQALGVLLLVGYATTVPPDLPHAPMVTMFRFFVLVVALLLFVATVPYATRGEQNGFWHYNRILFLRVLITGVYALVLFIGLLIALAALDNLFGVYVAEKRYLELWIVIIGLFATWFFLAGVPEDLPELDSLSEFPKGLKVFAQYILLPIVLIYLVILYAYLGKILIAWDWPQGWVSKLILGFSGAGLFLIFLLHPLVDRAGHLWIARVSRWFIVLLIPLVVMLFLAVWRRVSEYGMTEGRYLALALGVCLVFLIVYFTLSKTKSIKAIPIVLCLGAFLVSFGPWGMFSVARQSQVGRLEALVTEAGILRDGRVNPAHGTVPVRQAKEISAILSYLHQNHGYDEIQGWFGESLKEDTVSSGVAYKSPAAVAKLLDVEYVERWAESPEGFVTMEAGSAFDVSGFDRMVYLSIFPGGIKKVELPRDGISYRVPDGMDTLIFGSVATGEEFLRINLREHAESLLKERDSTLADGILPEKMQLDAAGRGLSVRVCPWRIQMQRRGDETKMVRINATILYSLKKTP